MRLGSWRWWFENRETGEITIAQFPNWPLWTIAALWIVRLALTDGTTEHDIVGWVVRALWIGWGLAELARGVNPWRRLLGAGVIATQVVPIIATIS